MKEEDRHRTVIRRGNRKGWAIAFAVVWLAHGYAEAQSPTEVLRAVARHRVLILTDEPGDPFLTRVQAEIVAVPGLEVTLRIPEGSLEAMAKAEHAEVAIRKAASGKGMEVWMADATSGRSLVRQLVVDESSNGPDQGLVALQTAELLRTGLLARPAAPKPSLPPAPPSASPVPAASSLCDNALQAGLGPLWSRGGADPSLQAWLSYQHLWSLHLGISVDASAPLVRGAISSAQGSADVGAVTAGAGVLARLASEHGHVAGTATLGAGFTRVFTKGNANANYESTTTTSYAGLAYLRLAVAWHPVDWLGLGGALLAGSTTSRIRIQFADQDVGDWGTPLFAAALCGEIDW